MRHEMRERLIFLVDDSREPTLGKRENGRSKLLGELGLLQGARTCDVEVVADVVELALRHGIERRRERRFLWNLAAVQLLLAGSLVLLHEVVQLLRNGLVVGDIFIWHSWKSFLGSESHPRKKTPYEFALFCRGLPPPLTRPVPPLGEGLKCEVIRSNLRCRRRCPGRLSGRRHRC